MVRCPAVLRGSLRSHLRMTAGPRTTRVGVGGRLSPHPARLRKRAPLPIKGRDGVRCGVTEDMQFLSAMPQILPSPLAGEGQGGGSNRKMHLASSRSSRFTPLHAPLARVLPLKEGAIKKTQHKISRRLSARGMSAPEGVGAPKGANPFWCPRPSAGRGGASRRATCAHAAKR